MLVCIRFLNRVNARSAFLIVTMMMRRIFYDDHDTDGRMKKDDDFLETDVHVRINAMVTEGRHI